MDSKLMDIEMHLIELAEKHGLDPIRINSKKVKAGQIVKCPHGARERVKEDTVVVHADFRELGNFRESDFFEKVCQIDDTTIIFGSVVK